MPSRRFIFGPFIFEPGRSTLLCDGSPVGIGHRAVAILHALLRAHGQVATKDELIDAAWPGTVVEESNLSVQIAALRKLLGRTADDTDWIITVPRVGYRFGGAVTMDSGGIARATAVEPAHSGRKPSIAVLPFANLSGDPGEDYFADGITEDIINGLSRYRWFFVFARHSTFRFKDRTADATEVARELEADYILTGSVRKSGQQIRVSAQLIDPRSAHQLWADRYDVALGDIFTIQDRVSQQVAGAIEPELLKTASVVAAKRRHAGDATAYDLVYQGIWYFHQITRATHLRAGDLFRKALELDPELPEAHLWLARVNAGLIAYGWTEDPNGAASEGVDAALKAMQADEKNPYAHYALAIISVFANRFDRAMRAAERAVELSPSFALAHLALGMARLSSGSASAAIAPLEHGVHLNPFDPQNFVWYNALALAHLLAGDAAKGRDNALKALKVRPVWRPTLETLACCYAQLGDAHAAHACANQIAKLDAMLDKPPTDPFGPMRRLNPRWAEELDALLVKARRSEPSVRRS